MSDSLINDISESLLTKAAQAVLHRFELPIKVLLECPDITLAGHKVPITIEPVGVMISVHTMDKEGVLNNVISEVLQRLEREQIIVGHDRVRELHAARFSSHQESLECFVYLINDASGELN